MVKLFPTFIFCQCMVNNEYQHQFETQPGVRACVCVCARTAVSAVAPYFTVCVTVSPKKRPPFIF